MCMLRRGTRWQKLWGRCHACTTFACGPGLVQAGMPGLSADVGRTATEGCKSQFEAQDTGQTALKGSFQPIAQGPRAVCKRVPITSRSFID